MAFLDQRNVDKVRQVQQQLDKLIALTGETDYLELSTPSENLTRDLFNVLFLGKLRSGKTTLINALVGKKNCR